MGRKTPSKAAKSFPPIASREEADQIIHDIGTLLRARGNLVAGLEERFAAMKAETGAALKPIADTIDAKIDALHAWALANRETLLVDGKRSAEFPQGKIGWRWNPAAVKVAKDQDDAVLAALEQHGLSDLVRTKKEIDREAILADPKRIVGIAGVKVEQSEQFWVKPAEIEIEGTKTSRKVQGADVAPSAPSASAQGAEKSAGGQRHEAA